MFVPKTLIQTQTGSGQDIRRNDLPSQFPANGGMISQGRLIADQNYTSYQAAPQGIHGLPNQQMPARTPYPFPETANHNFHQSPYESAYGLHQYVEPTLSAEAQVQQAVASVDVRISTARKERDLAMRLAAEETMKRIEAEAELERLQQEHKMLKAGTQAEAMISIARTVELDELFGELDKSFGGNLSFEHADDSINIEKYLKAGKRYVDGVSKYFEPLGQMSDFSDEEFVNARYMYLMDSHINVHEK